MLFEIEKPRHWPRFLYFKQHFDAKEQELIWNSNLLPKIISDMLIRNIQGQHHIKNMKSTCN